MKGGAAFRTSVRPAPSCASRDAKVLRTMLVSASFCSTPPQFSSMDKAAIAARGTDLPQGCAAKCSR
eukprot:121837-Alexandrium_andersonii.AAC.1